MRGIWVGLSLALAGCVRTSADVQRDAARALYPIKFWKDAPERVGAVRKLRARVWTQEEYRRAILGAEVRLFRQVNRVNAVLRARFGVELEIESIKPWPQEGRLSSLEVALHQLEAHDPGKDVDFVIGMITPLPVATPAIHQLGMARLMGKHLVLRAMDDTTEFSAFQRMFKELEYEERERLYVARREHKEVVVLLHELGHALGALHVRSPRAVMAPAHDHQIIGFSPPNQKLLQLGLEARGEGRRDAKSAKRALAKLRAHLETIDDAPFVGFGRARLLALLGAPKKLARATDRAVIASDDPALKREGYDRRREEAQAARPHGSDAARVEEAQRLSAGGDDQAALAVLRPALEAKSPGPDVLSTGCALYARQEPKAERTVELCRRATGVSAKMMLTYALIEREQPVEALEAARQAQAELAKIESPPAQRFELLAQLYQRLGAITWAAETAQKVKETSKGRDVLEWAKKTRVALGIEDLRPEDEPEYLRLRRALGRAMQNGQLEEAKRAARRLSKRFPSAPGPERVLCAQLGQARRFAEAEPHCQQVRAKDKRALRARLVLGMGAFARGRPKAAIAPLEEALKIQPNAQDVWRLLAAAYRAAGRAKRASRLADRYRQRFGRPLR